MDSRTCKRGRLRLALGVLLLFVSALAQAQAVKVFGLLELTGTGAPSGIAFDRGARLAVREINAAGGILGRQIDYRTYDTQSNPGVARGLAEQAVDEGAYVVLGPVFSGSTLVSMEVTRKAEVPNLTGSESAAITRQGNPYIFRTSIAQVRSMPRTAGFIRRTLKARTVDLVYVNNEFGRSGHQQIDEALRAEGMTLGRVKSVEPGQLNFGPVVRQLAQSGGDLLFVYVNEEEAARLLRELRKQAYSKPIVGDNVLTSQSVIELAGDAANGTLAHVGLTADAPNPRVQHFDRKFQAAYKVRSDHNGIKGYIAMYTVKAVTEKVGRFDQRAFAAAMKNLSLSSRDHPGLLLDLSYDDRGDLDRESYITRVNKGRQEVVEVISAGTPRAAR